MLLFRKQRSLLAKRKITMMTNRQYYCFGTPCKIINSWVEPANQPPHYFSSSRLVWQIELPSKVRIITGILHLSPSSLNAIKYSFDEE